MSKQLAGDARARRPNFQRRHYEIVADVIARAKARNSHGSVVDCLLSLEDNFADLFKGDNTNFRPGRFHAACDPNLSQDAARHLHIRRAE